MEINPKEFPSEGKNQAIVIPAAKNKKRRIIEIKKDKYSGHLLFSYHVIEEFCLFVRKYVLSF